MNLTEKVTINLNVVDLGNIDLLVNEGFYSNRTDFIKTAIRSHLTNYSEDIKKVIIKKNFCVGIITYGRKNLEKCVMRNEKLDIRVVGMLVLGEDISYDLAVSAINSIDVSGVLRCKQDIKDYFKT